jgi:hypothetical protein
MAIVNTTANRFKYGCMKKEVDCSTDDFKIALMKTTFTFDNSTHNKWSDVSGEEIAGVNGYTTGGQVLTSGELVQDNTNNRARIYFSGENLWTASGGSIEDTDCAIIYNDTHADKILAGHSDFGETVSVSSGLALRLRAIALNLN